MIWLSQIRRKQTNPRVPQIIIIALGFLLIILGKADVTAVRFMQGGLVEVIAPIYSVISVPVNSIETVFEGVQTVASLRSEANRLSAENKRLRKWQQLAESLEVQNRQLRTVLGAVIPLDWNSITARVIVVPGGNFSHSMIIEHGPGYDIATGSAVVTAEGLVGYIISSSQHYSRVLLISDVNARIPIILSDSSWPGLAVGKNGLILQLDFLPVESDPTINESVLTSGHGGLLPAGIPVGNVSSVTNETVLVKPTVDLRKLSFVTILTRKNATDFMFSPDENNSLYSPLIQRDSERLFEGLNSRELIQ
ncbi:rod shape-determining protein MreC [Alphaproteobacteria bacterium]|jgi:rod shape-determining protein MreC|nr:rod shape-determining protein MreC [Alphaproteobacteria bacterium]MDA9190862.1 rod shape-determining protein MreC [Alphaproteobacteria bacterium]